jgi:hypothetical protein
MEKTDSFTQVEIQQITNDEFYLIKTREQNELKELIDKLVVKHRRLKTITEPKEAKLRFGQYYLLCSKENGGGISESDWSWKRVKVLTEPNGNEEFVLRPKVRIFLIDDGISLTRNFSNLHVNSNF